MLSIVNHRRLFPPRKDPRRLYLSRFSLCERIKCDYEDDVHTFILCWAEMGVLLQTSPWGKGPPSLTSLNLWVPLQTTICPNLKQWAATNNQKTMTIISEAKQQPFILYNDWAHYTCCLRHPELHELDVAEGKQRLGILCGSDFRFHFWLGKGLKIKFKKYGNSEGSSLRNANVVKDQLLGEWTVKHGRTEQNNIGN